MSIPVYEQDTSINFGRNESELTLYSSDTTFINLLKSRGYSVPPIDSIGGVVITIPRSALMIRANKKQKRVLSPEHIAKMQSGRKKM